MADWVSVKEAASRLRLTTRTIRRHVERGKLEGRQIGNEPLEVNLGGSDDSLRVNGVSSDLVDSVLDLDVSKIADERLTAERTRVQIAKDLEEIRKKKLATDELVKKSDVVDALRKWMVRARVKRRQVYEGLSGAIAGLSARRIERLVEERSDAAEKEISEIKLDEL